MLTEAVLVEQYKLLHSTKKGYGRTGENGLFYYQKIIDALDFEVRSVLDYGCGKSNLINLLSFGSGRVRRYKYDPAVEEYAVLLIDKVDLLFCTDVLEHIPEHLLYSFIKRLSDISSKMIFTISVRESGNVLPNGLPCHLTVRPPDWWLDMLRNFFKEVYNLCYFPGPKKFLGTTFYVDVSYE